MSNEKRDEFFSWRGILDQPDALPEQGLDHRDLSWERLNARLQGKPRRLLSGWRGAVGWIAAACLVLALIPVFHLFKKQATQAQPSAAAVTTASSPAVMPATAPSSRELVDNTTILHSGPSRESLRKRSTQPAVQGPAQTRDAADNPRQKKTSDAAISPAPIARIINNPLPRDSPVLLAQQQEYRPEIDTQHSPKLLINKQLRVVHINELENNGHPEPAMTSIRERDTQLRILIVLKNH